MNIDKDIEILKKMFYEDESFEPNGYVEIFLHKNEQQAIENVLSELEKLREDNYTYHQLMRMQNAREYRSKFLKDFKKEYGENVMPDYDEIYKRYDKQKKELEKKDKELEIWKKVAGILASEYAKHVLCNNTVGGMKIREVEDILDWAKREINKGEE